MPNRQTRRSVVAALVLERGPLRCAKAHFAGGALIGSFCESESRRLQGSPEPGPGRPLCCPSHCLTDGGADHGSDDHVARVVHSGVDAGVADGAGEQAQWCGRGGKGVGYGVGEGEAGCGVS
jgi:hypothetical protein